MIWNQDPELIKIGTFSIRWYGFLFALGVFIGSELVKYIKNRTANMNFDIDKLFLFVVGGLFIGARLGHCFFYEPEIYLADPMRVFHVWEGGLASHGALIGVAIALVAFSKIYRVEVFALCDLVVPGSAFSGAMIRLGNFFNSEIIGNETNVPWSVTFSRIDSLPRHPTQLYEAFWYFFICAVIVLYTKKKNFNVSPGRCLGIYLMGTFVFRFLIEFLKIPQVSFERDMTLNMGQLLSIPLILLGVYFFFFHKNKPSK